MMTSILYFLFLHLKDLKHLLLLTDQLFIHFDDISDYFFIDYDILIGLLKLLQGVEDLSYFTLVEGFPHLTLNVCLLGVRVDLALIEVIVLDSVGSHIGFFLFVLVGLLLQDNRLHLLSHN